MEQQLFVEVKMKRFLLLTALLLAVFTLFPEETETETETLNNNDQAEELPAEQPAEAPAEQQAEQPTEAPAETPAEQPAETPAEEKKEPEKEPTYIILTTEPVLYYRPYKTAGIALLAVGLAADVAGGITYYTGWFKDDDKMMLGGLITSIVGAPLWITGAILIGIRKPVPNQNVEVSSFSVTPTKGGVYASLGLNF